MIPKNITQQDILDAIRHIDINGIPKGRFSHKYNLVYNGKLYPPKFLISVANRLVNGKELESFLFGGGEETNNFLKKLGFEIISSNDEIVFSDIKSTDNLKITTVVIENRSGYCPDNDERFSLMKKTIVENKNVDVMLFPAGFYYLRHQRAKTVEKLCEEISIFLNSIGCTSVICFGVDCDNGKDQLVIAVNSKGIQAMGRKFYPTSDENGWIRSAYTYNDTEMGYPRIFKIKNKTIYPAVCYDVFGIRHKNLPNCGIDAVLALAHRFCKRGEGSLGDVDFARKGFAGASQHWSCPVFGTAVFFEREIPKNWPTGVLWTEKNKSVKSFKYIENKLKCNQRKRIVEDLENALCNTYILPV